MKKRMRIAAILASATMVCGALPAMPVSAEIWTLTDSDTDAAFQDMIPLDDKGMLNFSGTDAAYQVYMQYVTDYYDTETVNPETGETSIERVYYDNCRLYVVSPRMNIMQFKLRANMPEAEPQMLAILEQYYPGISQSYQQRIPNENASLEQNPDGSYELWDKTENAGSAELADSIMRALAKAGLLTEFYTWGQTAYCQNYGGWREYPAEDFDREKVEAYLAEQGLPYTVDEKVYEAGSLTWSTYQITPDHELTFAEQFTLAADIYEATGIRPEIWSYADMQPAIGQNALAVPGDVDIDGDLTLKDAVLLAKVIGAVSGAELSPEGFQNADLDGDGHILAGDLTALLRILSGMA